MWSAATVVVCALSLLGRSEQTLPPIAFVDVPPADASPQAEGFVRRGSDDTIYLITSTSTFQAAQRARYRCGNVEALAKLASVIVHEEWHVLHGPDEKGAYTAQMMALRSTLKVDPDRPLFKSVRASMNAVLKEQRSKTAAMLVAGLSMPRFP